MLVLDTSDMPSGLTEYEGRDVGAGTSLIFVDPEVDGEGPALHQHPYSETFVIQSGEAVFTVGDRTMLGRAGQVVVVPAWTPHRFAKTGEGRLRMVDVHASDHFVTERTPARQGRAPTAEAAAEPAWL